MTDLVKVHAEALEATGAIVAGIPPDRWPDATPCAGWDVRALVNHIVSGNLWAAELAAGATIGEVGDRFGGDLLGARPVEAYAASAQAAAAFGRRGSWTRHARSPMGRSPVRSTPGTGLSRCSRWR